MSKSLDKLISIRKVHRTLATKAINKCDSLILSVSGRDITQDDILQLTAVIDSLSYSLQNISNANNEIYEVSTLSEEQFDELVSNAEGSYSEKQSKKHSFVAILTSWKDNFKCGDINPSHLTNSSLTSTSTSNKQVALPKLDLPTFSGNVLEYFPFWDAFQAAMDNRSLTKVHKFQYLISKLKGPALDAVRGFQITESNYDAAVAILNERFGQKHLLISEHMNNILNLNCKSSSLMDMRYFFDNLEIGIRSLEALGEDPKSYSNMLCPLIVSKIPASIKANIIRKLGDRQYTLCEIREELKSEIAILEHCNTVNSKSASSHIFLTPSQSTSSNSKIICSFCKSSEHHSTNCTIIADVEKRLEFVRKNRLCYNCLKNHKIENCKSKFCCKFCHKKHHSSLCKSEKTIVETSSNDTKAKTDKKTADAGIANINIGGNVLLETAYVNVAYNSKSIDSYLIFVA